MAKTVPETKQFPDVEIVLLQKGREVAILDSRARRSAKVPYGTYDVEARQFRHRELFAAPVRYSGMAIGNQVALRFGQIGAFAGARDAGDTGHSRAQYFGDVFGEHARIDVAFCVIGRYKVGVKSAAIRLHGISRRAVSHAGHRYVFTGLVSDLTAERYPVRSQDQRFPRCP